MSREKFEAVATHALGVYDAAVRDKLADLLKSAEEHPGMNRLRQAMRVMTGTLMGEKLLQAGATHPDRIAGLADDRLKELADQTREVAIVAGEDALATDLDSVGKRDFMRAIIDAGDALAQAGYEMPRAELLATAVANAEADEPVAEAPQRVIPDHALHAVARSAIDFLDAVYVVNPDLRGSADAMIAAEDIEKLRDTLRAANYLLPGESSAREGLRNTGEFKPYYNQDGRGSREQNEAILAAAKEMAAHLVASDVLATLSVGNAFATVGMKTKLGVLNSFIEQAQPEDLSAEALAEQKIATPLGNDVLPKEAADAVLEVLNQAKRITDTAQLDTQSALHVMYPKQEHAALEARLKTLDTTKAANIIDGVARLEEALPGISDASARVIGKIINEMRGFAAHAEKRDGFRAVPMEDLDYVISMTNDLTNVGVYNSLAALAGRGELTTTAFNDGRDSAAFATLKDAMSGGRAQSPERALGLIGKVTPVMSLAEYNQLSAETRTRRKVFILRSGENGMPEFSETVYPHPKAQRWSNNGFRKALRDTLVNEDGTPNLAARAKLLSLKGVPIVAKSKGHAVVLTEEIERLDRDRRKQLEQKRADYLAKASKTTADFGADQVKRFLGVLEASNAGDLPALVKRNNELVLEHPEAPTITARMDDLGPLARARDGYQLHKIDPKELRAAYEMGRPVIRIHLEDDRPSVIVGHDPDRAATKQRETQVHAIGA